MKSQKGMPNGRPLHSYCQKYVNDPFNLINNNFKSEFSGTMSMESQVYIENEEFYWTSWDPASSNDKRVARPCWVFATIYAHAIVSEGRFSKINFSK